jgi:hypothetical protein
MQVRSPFPRESRTLTLPPVCVRRLAQLVRTSKRRTHHDSLGSEVNDVVLDESVELEGKISQFISDLPTDYQFDLNSPPSLEVEDSYTSLILARSCELQIVANRMIISLYIPHLKTHSVNPLHQASLSIMNAAHKIIQCMKIWRSRRNCSGVRERGRWGSFGVYYDYGRILFDAAVVCASIAIGGTGGAFAACLKGDVDSALEVLKDMEEFKGLKRCGLAGTGMPSGVEANVSEPVAIVEMLKQKVEANQVAGIKRKRRDGEIDVLQPGFRIPFVGAAVSASIHDPTPLVPPEFTSDTSPVPPLDQSEPLSRVKIEDRSDDPISDKKRQKQKSAKNVLEVPPDKRKLAKARPKDKEKDKETKYPSYGIRIRPGFPPPYARGRGSAPQTSKMPKLTLAPTDGSNGQPNTPPIETPSTLPPNSAVPSPLLMPQHLDSQQYEGSFPPTPVREQPTADDNHRRPLTTPFDTGPDVRMQPRGRYNNDGYSTTPAFFDHSSYPGSQVTSPTSTETPPFPAVASTQSGPGQFPGASQPHQGFFSQTFRDPPIGSNGFESISYNGVGPPQSSYPMNSMEHGPSSAVTEAAYMAPDGKVPLSVFMPNEPQMLSGSSQPSPQDLHVTRGHDWQPPAQNLGDQQYWF